MITYLSPSYGQKSFYNKAIVITCKETIVLKSYNTVVSCIDMPSKKLTIYGWFSKTTALHLNSFLIQNGFKAMSKKEIEKYKK